MSFINCKVIKKTVLGATRWLSFLNVEYSDAYSRINSWDFVERNGGGVVVIVPVLVPSHTIILVKQFRPPLGKVCLELPAGLIDEGESPQQAAARELLEETGYEGAIKNISPLIVSSAGLSNESVCLVTIEISENFCPKNPDFKDNEYIEVEKVAIKDLLDHLNTQSTLGVAVDAKLYSVAVGFSLK